MKNELRKFLMALFSLLITTSVSICASMFGWGLEPKSWFWIIVAPISAWFIAVGLLELSKDDKK